MARQDSGEPKPQKWKAASGSKTEQPTIASASFNITGFSSDEDAAGSSEAEGAPLNVSMLLGNHGVFARKMAEGELAVAAVASLPPVLTGSATKMSPGAAVLAAAAVTAEAGQGRNIRAGTSPNGLAEWAGWSDAVKDAAARIIQTQIQNEGSVEYADAVDELYSKTQTVVTSRVFKAFWTSQRGSLSSRPVTAPAKRKPDAVDEDAAAAGRGAGSSLHNYFKRCKQNDDMPADAGSADARSAAAQIKQEQHEDNKLQVIDLTELSDTDTD